MTILTDKELEFIKLKSEDKRNREISRRFMFLSESTLKQITRKLYIKTGTTTLGGLIAWAYKNGVLETNEQRLPQENRKAG